MKKTKTMFEHKTSHELLKSSLYQCVVKLNKCALFFYEFGNLLLIYAS